MRAPARLAGRGTLCQAAHGARVLGQQTAARCRVFGLPPKLAPRRWSETLSRHAKPTASDAASHMFYRRLWGCRLPQASNGRKSAPGATEPSDHDGPGQRLALRISPPSAGRSAMTGGKESQGFQKPPRPPGFGKRFAQHEDWEARAVCHWARRRLRWMRAAPVHPTVKGSWIEAKPPHLAYAVSDAGYAGKPVGVRREPLATARLAGPARPG